MKTSYLLLIAAAFAIPAKAENDIAKFSCDGKTSVTVAGRIDSVVTEGQPPVHVDTAPSPAGGLLGELGYTPKVGSDMPPSSVGEATGPGAAPATKPVKTGNGADEVSTENLDKPHKNLSGQDLTQWNQYCEGRKPSEVSEWRKKKCASLDADFK